MSPGVCCYPNETVYVFCGLRNKPLSSVEKKTKDSSWKRLNIIFFKPIFNIVAIPYDTNILLFGGYFNPKERRNESVMAIYSEKELKMINLINVGEIPLYMGTRPHIVVNENIYVAVQKQSREYVSRFDGTEWEIVY